jgi:PTH1 family peptidyl-tRNA hydrolase
LKLFVGLGNPGSKYERTLHNAGFWLIDELIQDANGSWESIPHDKFEALLGRGSLNGESCVFAKPLTFMNLSGRAVQKIAQFYKVSSADWIVLQDDIDLPFATVKARVGGGHGGHNGIRSILEVTGRQDFSRVKLGVGRPEDDQNIGVADYVLKPLPSAVIEGFVQQVKPEVTLRLKDLLKRHDA